MNWEHFRAFLWLRWRVQRNQLRRAGIGNSVLLVLLAVALFLFSVFLFAGSFLLGLFVLPLAPPEVLLFVWDGLVVFFLFCWAIGLLTELQRSEALSLDKFLHLPVSLSGAFLINYLSSLFSLTLLLFLPATLGLTLALVCNKGPLVLLILPLLAAFILMVTAISYQFQGWLASLMVNQRRRRTIIVVVTVSFILLCQMPNLVHWFQPWKDDARDAAAARWKEQEAALRDSLASGRITNQQFRQEQAALQAARRGEENQADLQMLQQVAQTTRIINMVLPPGWLPLGAEFAAEGSAWPGLLGTLGMTVLGAASLWRAYRTTLRLYTGQFTSGKRPAAVAAAPPKERKPAGNLVEKELPWLPEQAAAVALGTLRSLLRAPEAKMLCLAPIILTVVFGGIMMAHRVELPESLRPLLPFAALFFVLVCTVQLVGNQFGFDRSGFRVFVLSPAPRSSILLGKNLAFAPLMLTMGLVLVILLQVLSPMRPADFLAIGPQAVSMYLLFCLLANLLSILGPMRIAAGTLKPTSPQLVPILLQLVFLCLLPPVLGLTLLPLGVQLLVETLDWVHGLPICLLLALAECAGIVFLYRAALTWQGQVLEEREQLILERVATKE